jgi:hypothetical protein
LPVIRPVASAGCFTTALLLLTVNTLTVLDQHRRDIPVDQIDLNATAKVNLQAGVEFSLPGRPL